MVRFDEKVKCGAEYVALRVADKINGLERTAGGIYLSESAFANSKLGLYKVEDIGETAERLTDVHVGETVLADRLAIFYKSEPLGIMRYNSMIVKTDLERSYFRPLLNMCIVEQDKSQVQQQGGIYVQDKEDILNIGTLVSKNIAPDVVFPFEVGDKVFLSKCSDFVRAGTRNLYIYKAEDVLCKIEV